MGYRVDTQAVLVLEDMDGAEVSVTIGVPIRAVEEYDTTEGVRESWAVLVRWAKPSWNLEDADGPIPADESAYDRLSVPVLRAVMRGWREATVHPPAPLPQPSSGTA